MAAVNKVILIGNLGRDPEMRAMPSGEQVANLAIATTEKWTDKSGEKKESVEWHRVVFFGRQAEICAEYLRKGSSVYVEGQLATKKYTDKDGVEKFSTEIRGRVMQMLGGGGERQERPQQARPAQPQRPASSQQASDSFDDGQDIPFANPYRGRLSYVV